MRTLFTVDGHSRQVDAKVVEGLVAAGKEVFWLDIQAPDDDDYKLLTDTFKFHQLTIEDVKHQNQRPKLDGYDGYVFAVLFVIGFKDNQVEFREHHMYIAPQFLVTVHDLPEPGFLELNQRIAESPESACRKTSFLTYLVMDALVDSTFDSLEALDTSVDKLQDDILVEAIGHREGGFGLRMVDADVVFHFGDAEREEIGLDGGGTVESPGGIDEGLDELRFGGVFGVIFV